MGTAPHTRKCERLGPWMPLPKGATCTSTDDATRQGSTAQHGSRRPLVQTATRNLDDARSLHEHMVQLLDLLRRVDERLRAVAGSDGA